MIHVSGLVKTYGDLTAVAGVSFDVAAGEIFAFLGPNGAGKTTTIQMLTTLVPPTSGTIAIDGLDPQKHASEVRRRFGIVFQDPSLDGELTAWENMEIHGVLYHVAGRTRHERTEQLLKLFELWDRRDAYVKTFSGGMKRRLEIARGFLHTPKILFAGGWNRRWSRHARLRHQNRRAARLHLRHDRHSSSRSQTCHRRRFSSA